MSHKSNGQKTEAIDLVELEKQQLIVENIKTLENLRFGPCDINPSAWRSIKLSVRAHSSQPEGKEIPLALLGKLVGKRFLIEDVVQILARDAGPIHCIYDIQDIKKIAKEAEKNKQTLLGTAHSHTEGSPTQPSHLDRIAWLSLMFEFDRPLFYYIIIPDTLHVSAYSISSTDAFLLLKESIKPIECEMEGSD